MRLRSSGTLVPMPSQKVYADVSLSPAFYLTFWQMSTYDLSPPTAKYEEESQILRTLSRQEDTMYNIADRSSDRAKRLTANVHREKRNRMNIAAQELTNEAKDHTAARSFTIKRLGREKQHWFAHSKSEYSITTAVF